MLAPVARAGRVERIAGNPAERRQRIPGLFLFSSAGLEQLRFGALLFFRVNCHERFQVLLPPVTAPCGYAGLGLDAAVFCFGGLGQANACGLVRCR